MSQSRVVTARDLRASRRRRRRRGPLIAAAAAAAAAFAAGAFVGAGTRQHPYQRLAAHYTAAWEHGDWARMWSLSGGPRRPGPARFAARYRAAAQTATVDTIRFGRPRRPRDGVVIVPAVVRTRIWGPLRAQLRLPMTGEGDGAHVAWGRELVFPGLHRGERLRRETTMPARAGLRFRDNTPLAVGPARSS